MVCTMIASRIVEPLYVIEYLRSGVIPCFVYLPLHSVFLKQREEGLGNRVVVAVSSPTHACFQVVILKEYTPVAGRVLHALIRVN